MSTATQETFTYPSIPRMLKSEGPTPPGYCHQCGFTPCLYVEYQSHGGGCLMPPSPLIERDACIVFLSEVQSQGLLAKHFGGLSNQEVYALFGRAFKSMAGRQQ